MDHRRDLETKALQGAGVVLDTLHRDEAFRARRQRIGLAAIAISLCLVVSVMASAVHVRSASQASRLQASCETDAQLRLSSERSRAAMQAHPDWTVGKVQTYVRDGLTAREQRIKAECASTILSDNAAQAPLR